HAEFDESNTYVLERFDTSAGNPVKEILLKLNLPDHRILKDGGEVKEFQERCLIQAFKTKKQQQYEHVGPKVTGTQDGKRSQDDDSRLCLVDDLKVLKITYSHTSQAKGTSSSLKSMITRPYSQEKEKEKKSAGTRTKTFIVC
ncbi:hypothetical protein Tco_1366945, partial [Tanacetum coccineum]